MRAPVDCVAVRALRLCSKRAVQPARGSRMSLRLLAVIAVAACAVEASVRKVCAAGQSTAIWPVLPYSRTFLQASRKTFLEGLPCPCVRKQSR